MKYDLAVIICATDLVQAYEVCENIRRTSGVSCQFLIHDNSKDRCPIAKVYNMYGRIAKATNLLFVHQDISFIGGNWGRRITEKLSEKTCGCIGYAGSVVRPKDYYAGWPVSTELSRNNYCHFSESNRIFNAVNDDYDEVVVIDGLAMFCRKDVFLKNSFDEKALPGFHCYDIDFSLTLHTNGYHNYVVTDKRHFVIHQSVGKYNREWLEDTLDITNKKWNRILPVSVSPIQKTEYADSVKKANTRFVSLMHRFFDAREIASMLNKIPAEIVQYAKAEIKNANSGKALGQVRSMPYLNNGYRDWN